MLYLDRFQLFVQLIVFEIADDRVVVDVIPVFMIDDQAPEVFQSLFNGLAMYRIFVIQISF